MFTGRPSHDVVIVTSDRSTLSPRTWECHPTLSVVPSGVPITGPGLATPAEDVGFSRIDTALPGRSVVNNANLSDAARPRRALSRRRHRLRLVRDGEPFLLGLDTYAYWSVDPAAPYEAHRDATQIGAFLYSPAAALIAGLFGALPWVVFAIGWLGLLVAALAWMGRWWTLALLAFPPVVYSLWLGNIDVLVAAAIVAGFRWPAAWAFVLLTKVTPGVGLLWFVVRREWRNLAIAVGATGAIGAVSLVLAPELWFAWPAALLTIEDGVFQPVPLWVRLVLAVVLVVWGARTGHRWTVAVAGAIAIPWISARSLAMLVGVIPLLRGVDRRLPSLADDMPCGLQ